MFTQSITEKLMTKI